MFQGAKGLRANTCSKSTKKTLDTEYPEERNTIQHLTQEVHLRFMILDAVVGFVFVTGTVVTGSVAPGKN